MSKEIFYTVKAVKVETPDSISISFESSEKISYKAGQYLTLIQSIAGEEIRRCYSLSSSPSDGGLPTITLKKVAGGKMSTWLLENAKEGMKISGYTPMGNFVLPENSDGKNHVYIGGGSGITPLYSMIREGFKKSGRKQFLFYVNRNEGATIFRESLNEDSIRHSDFRIAHHYTEIYKQPNANAILNWLKTLSIKPEETQFFLCGPEGLMKEALDALASWNVKSDSIFKELFFTTPTHPTASVGPEAKDYSVTIQFQKKTYNFVVPKDKTILESALDNKIRLPHSCQSGLCTACMGHCLQGQVSMVDPEGLSDNEIKKGCVLTCVGRPASEGVLIKID